MFVPLVTLYDLLKYFYGSPAGRLVDWPVEKIDLEWMSVVVL